MKIINLEDYRKNEPIVILRDKIKKHDFDSELKRVLLALLDLDQLSIKYLFSLVREIIPEIEKNEKQFVDSLVKHKECIEELQGETDDIYERVKRLEEAVNKDLF